MGGERGSGVDSASIIIQRSIDTDRGDLEYRLPQSLRELVLMDRSCGSLLERKIPKIMLASLHPSRGIGLAADYFFKLVHQLRAITAHPLSSSRQSLQHVPRLCLRQAVIKQVSALRNLLWLELEYDKKILEVDANLMVELETRVRKTLIDKMLRVFFKILFSRRLR